jgi:hypothetical protein
LVDVHFLGLRGCGAVPRFCKVGLILPIPTIHSVRKIEISFQPSAEPYPTNRPKYEKCISAAVSRLLRKYLHFNQITSTDTPVYFTKSCKVLKSRSTSKTIILSDNSQFPSLYLPTKLGNQLLLQISGIKLQDRHSVRIPTSLEWTNSNPLQGQIVKI